MEGCDGDWRIGTYEGFAHDLAEQFARGESVDTGNLTYLREFSDESRASYDWLMDQIGEMYDVEPFDPEQEAQRLLDHASRDLGQLVTRAMRKFPPPED